MLLATVNYNHIFLGSMVEQALLDSVDAVRKRDVDLSKANIARPKAGRYSYYIIIF
jgi:hypothetical protein